MRTLLRLFGPHGRYRILAAMVGIGLALWLRHALWLHGIDHTFITAYPAIAVIALTLGTSAGYLATGISALYLSVPLSAAGIDETPAGIVAVGLFTAMNLLVVWLIGRVIGQRRVDLSDVLRDLDESETRYRMLVERVADRAICTLDARGVVRSWSPAAERIEGWKARDILGQSFATLYPEADRVAGRPEADLAQAASTGETRRTGPRARRDGSLFEAEVTLFALRGSDGKLSGYSQIVRDLGAPAS